VEVWKSSLKKKPAEKSIFLSIWKSLTFLTTFVFPPGEKFHFLQFPTILKIIREKARLRAIQSSIFLPVSSPVYPKLRLGENCGKLFFSKMWG
jgi:hypothetical protein